jgi:hypothetical protein
MRDSEGAEYDGRAEKMFGAPQGFVARQAICRTGRVRSEKLRTSFRVLADSSRQACSLTCDYVQALAEVVDGLLGLHVEGKDLHFSHMAWRSLVVFIVAIVLARVADRRFMGRSACFDFMLGVILGSVLSRGINGQAPFFPTLGASALLVVLHRIVGTIAFHSHRWSLWLKGRECVLVENGRINDREMERNHITFDDLCEYMRINRGVTRVEDVARATLERNGTISVVAKR